MMKKYIQTVAAVFGVMFVFDFVVHGILLKGLYEAAAGLWRPFPEMQRLAWTMWIFYLVTGLVLPYLYAKGYEAGKPAIGQGVRFGLALGVLSAAGMSLGTYFMIPLPLSLAVTWFVSGMVLYVLLGVVIAALQRRV